MHSCWSRRWQFDFIARLGRGLSPPLRKLRTKEPLAAVDCAGGLAGVVVECAGGRAGPVVECVGVLVGAAGCAGDGVPSLAPNLVGKLTSPTLIISSHSTHAVIDLWH